jgi:hypothetical protein
MPACPPDVPAPAGPPDCWPLAPAALALGSLPPVPAPPAGGCPATGGSPAAGSLDMPFGSSLEHPTATEVAIDSITQTATL